MAVQRRTKAHKQQVSQKREEGVYTFDAPAGTQRSRSEQSGLVSDAPASSLAAYFAYDPAFIYQDLKKTVLVSTVLIALLVGIWMYIR
ncbi:MAG: hypothetical protein H6774_04060 [Pseudomonadales bacterium]|nr:hypothetical protein [Candidatus Woesebacteria bacterium]MCB9802235.1 hypothetical protein [Pseudomonadales bacterium]